MLKVKAKCLNIKEFGDYRIINWSPISGDLDQIRYGEYNKFKFSTKGYDTYISVNEEHDLVLEEMERGYDKKWGSSYKIRETLTIQDIDFSNMTREESFEILMNCTSSKTNANNILDAYENFIEIIMTQGKEAIDLSKIKGVGQAYLNAYTRNLTDKYKYYTLLRKYAEYKLNINDCRQLYNYYYTIEEIDRNIKEHPYEVLIKALEKSFKSVDRLLLEIRPEFKESFDRCTFLILDVISIVEQGGSTRISGNDVYSFIENNYNVPELMDLIVPTAMENEHILLRYKDVEFLNEDGETEVESVAFLSSMATYLKEKKIANFFHEKVQNPIIHDFDYTQFEEIKDGVLTDEQKKVLELITMNNAVILNGFAGSGKTSAMLSILEMLDTYNKSYLCLAPTGKASSRFTEQTNKPCKTIHKACLNGNINSEFLILEEFSFISIDLMIMIIDAIDNEDIKILLLGDIAQLPPIGTGAVVKDLIESSMIPQANLTKIFRFSDGGMMEVSTNARNKKLYLREQDLDKDEVILGKNQDYKYIRFKNSFDDLEREYKRLLENNKPEDICVITPRNIGEFGAFNINNKLQFIANPPNAKSKEIKNKFKRDDKEFEFCFRKNDIVMNTVNNYSMMSKEDYEMLISNEGIISRDDIGSKEVFNGQMGKILAIKDSVLEVLFGEEIIVYDKNDMKNLILGYSVNSFKMQGSQAKHIILLTLNEHSNQLNRNLLYTNLTRASKSVVEIADIEAIKKAIATDGADRDTWLYDLCIELMEEKNDI